MYSYTLYIQYIHTVGCEAFIAFKCYVFSTFSHVRQLFKIQLNSEHLAIFFHFRQVFKFG